LFECSARAKRKIRLDEAVPEAEKAVAALKVQLERELDTKETDASLLRFQKEEAFKTEKEMSEISNMFDRNKETVIDLMLHQITTVEIEVSEAQVQAWLSLQRTQQRSQQRK